MKKVARFRGGLTSDYNSMDSHGNSTSATVGVRTTGRIKKAKVVFDPSDNYTPRSHRPPSTSTASSTSTIPANHPLEIGEKRLQQQRSQNLDKGKNQHQQSHASESSSSSLASGSSIDGEKCTICHRREPRKGAKKLIACIDCDNNAHLSCMKIMFEDLSVLRNNYRCDNCRTCASCFEGPEDGELVTCSKCVKSFHFGCHIPSMTRLAHNSKWLCSKCTPKINNSNTMPARSIRDIIVGDIKLPDLQQKQKPTVVIATKRNSLDESSAHSSHSQAKQQKTAQQPPQLPQQIAKNVVATHQNHAEKPPAAAAAAAAAAQQQVNITSNNEERIHPQKQIDPLQNHHNCTTDLIEIPEVKEWSIDKVVEFFGKYFPKEAHVFQEHEIDGQSLLLLKRSDVIKKLPLKLGPSLRIYNLIVKIQSKSNDPTIGWLN